jgi:hypothetical protein
MTYEGSSGSSAIDHILISHKSTVRDAQVLKTIRQVESDEEEDANKIYDPHTPHNMIIAYINLHTLPQLFLTIPTEKAATIPKQPHTPEQEELFNKTFTQKLQNDEQLKHAIQTPEFRAKMESSSQRVQAALLQERMSAQTPNE